ncbi:hypothetical protein V5799_006111 [Amblyomma americanum]|uniref:C2H2-type domain-containing protein n=1 Tax=Amblyomma americanum TaxID=6943 RepID=A0AAQ4DXB7_AMBAM
MLPYCFICGQEFEKLDHLQTHMKEHAPFAGDSPPPVSQDHAAPLPVPPDQELPPLPPPPASSGSSSGRDAGRLLPYPCTACSKRFKQAIDKFGEAGGEGEYLHRMLTYRYKRMDNWLDEWWLHSAYLDVRTPLPVHSSPAALFPRQTFSSEEDCLMQALPPDMARHIPLDMTMYFKIFSLHRVPKPQRDEVVSYADEADPPRHIVVMHNNHLFEMNVYNQHSRKPYKERDLYPQLVAIMNQSRSVGPPIGILTSDDRDSWCAANQRLAAAGEERVNAGNPRRFS